MRAFRARAYRDDGLEFLCVVVTLNKEDENLMGQELQDTIFQVFGLERNVVYRIFRTKDRGEDTSPREGRTYIAEDDRHKYYVVSELEGNTLNMTKKGQ